MRDFELVSDEPVEVGGTDTGPMPTEFFLASLAACFTMAVAHVARKQGVALPDLSVRVRGRYEGLRFSHIRLEVSSSHPLADLQSFVDRAKSYCYVSNTLKRQPELEFVAAPNTVSQGPGSQRR